MKQSESEMYIIYMYIIYTDIILERSRIWSVHLKTHGDSAFSVYAWNGLPLELRLSSSLNFLKGFKSPPILTGIWPYCQRVMLVFFIFYRTVNVLLIVILLCCFSCIIVYWEVHASCCQALRVYYI